jgi:hypothetical protein
VQLGEVAGAEELKKYITDVDYELAEAEEMHLELAAIDFDIDDIIVEQDVIYKKYKKKLKEIKLC